MSCYKASHMPNSFFIAKMERTIQETLFGHFFRLALSTGHIRPGTNTVPGFQNRIARRFSTKNATNSYHPAMFSLSHSSKRQAGASVTNQLELFASMVRRSAATQMETIRRVHTSGISTARSATDKGRTDS